METSEVFKILVTYSALLRSLADDLLSTDLSIYEDERCIIYEKNLLEISVYKTGDIFVRPAQNKPEPKKIKCTYHPKYNDPLKKSPFNNNVSSKITTPSKESLTSSPKTQTCKWKFGKKEDLEAANHLESLFTSFKN